MAEQRHAGAEPGIRRPLGQGLRRWDKTGADAIAAVNLPQSAGGPSCPTVEPAATRRTPGRATVTGTVDAGR